MDGSEDIIPSEALNYQAPVPSSVDDIIPHEALKSSTTKSVYDPNRETFGQPIGDLIEHGAKGAYHTIAGGYRGIIDLARGQGLDQATKDIQDEQDKTPAIPAKSQAVIDRSTNFLHGMMPATSLPGMIQPAADVASDKASDWGAPPLLAAAIKSAPTAAMLEAPLSGAFERPGLPVLRDGRVPPGRMGPAPAAAAAERRALPAPEQPPLTATGTERPAYFEVNDPKASDELGIKPEKQEAQEKPTGGALPDAQQASRLALAKRVGLKEVRTSAITGDGQAAADDFDSTKYTNDPTGERMRGVMKNERQALADHASGIIEDLGGREGTDQTTRIAKGKTMAAPLDALSDHIDAATTKAYEAAKAKGGTEPVQFPELEKALTDKTLTNSLLAQGKEGFLKGVQSQWDDFKANNPGGVNAGVAEQYRQFLNTLWKTNPEAVSKLKDAMDSDMHAHFGENLFGEARQLHQLGAKLLDNPKGVAQIVGKDPHTPVNRVTAFEDIPDKVANMTGEQFKNLINTYKMMPEELQPQAQAAIKEIQGHMVNRLLDAGSKYETQWNKKGVNNELASNSENFKTAFADNPQAAAKIKDLKDAGEMLRFNSGYRGAHAQASNMERSGVGKVASGVGGAVGGTVGHMVAGPLGIIPGAAAGKMGVSSGLGRLDRARILKAAEERVTKIP